MAHFPMVGTKIILQTQKLSFIYIWNPLFTAWKTPNCTLIRSMEASTFNWFTSCFQMARVYLWNWPDKNNGLEMMCIFFSGIMTTQKVVVWESKLNSRIFSFICKPSIYWMDIGTTTGFPGHWVIMGPLSPILKTIPVVFTLLFFE